MLGGCFNQRWVVLTCFVIIVDFQFLWQVLRIAPVFRISEKIQVVFSINGSEKILNRRFSGTVFTSHSHKSWFLFLYTYTIFKHFFWVFHVSFLTISFCCGMKLSLAQGWQYRVLFSFKIKPESQESPRIAS